MTSERRNIVDKSSARGVQVVGGRPRQTVTTGVEVHSRNAADQGERKGVKTHSKRGTGAAGAEKND